MSFLFYDLETFGLSATRQRIAQFAAIRTDEDLNVVGEPVDFLIRPASDVLPSPMSCAVTMADPWHLQDHGLSESDAMVRIHDLMREPGTCTLGHNSFRFDDAFIRNGFYRNFLPIYDREWRDGNSRFDTINALRAAYALRPDGIAWPSSEQAPVNFKLEELAALNEVRTGDAHEALSDVRATIGMARLIKQHHPKFWHYLLTLRDKRRVRELLLDADRPVLLAVKGSFGVANACAAPILPLFADESDTNKVIVFNLRQDPRELADTESGLPMTGLTKLALNESPPLFALRHVTEPELDRLQLERAVIEERATWLREHLGTLDLQRRWRSLRPDYGLAADVDEQLYEQFFSPADESWRQRVHGTPPAQLTSVVPRAQGDARLPEMLWRFRARNYPDTLTPQERRDWNVHCLERFQDPDNPQGLAAFAEEMQTVRTQFADDTAVLELMDRVQSFADHLVTQSSVV